MHFMNYRYTEYVRRVAAPRELKQEDWEWTKHERWTPHRLALTGYESCL
jgi:hypothetical protein